MTRAVPPPAAAPDDPLRPIALELRHLRLVLAIVETGGVTRAGERLHLTQSALSHQLQEIERRLRVPLFLRVKKRLVPTEAGRRVVEAARRLLADVVALEHDLGGHAAGRRGVLRLATECYTAYDWLPPLLERFGRRYPEVEVRLAVEATAAPLAALRAGEVDLAVVTAPVADRAVECRPLFDDELLLAVAPDHRLAGRRFVRPADLAGERVLVYATPQENRFYQEFLVRHGVVPRETLSVRLTEAIVAMVRSGFGVGALAGWAMAREIRRGELVGVRLGPRGLGRSWLAASRRGPREPAYLGEFAALVAEHAAPSRFEAQRLRASS